MLKKKSKVKKVVFSLILVSPLVNAYAMMKDIDDHIEGIKYGSSSQFNASVRIIDVNPPSLEMFIDALANKKFTFEASQNVGLNLSNEQLLHVKDCILKSGGPKDFFIKNTSKIKVIELPETITFTIEDGVFEPKFNLSTIQYTRHICGGSTGTIIDVESIGLPLEWQRRVFITCNHQFRKNPNEKVSNSVLSQRFVDVAYGTEINMIHKTTFKRYKIDSLFYALNNDVAFGILEAPVEEHITPLKVVMDPLKFEGTKFITVSGYGLGTISNNGYVSENRIDDGIRRAGHEMINCLNMEEILCCPFEETLKRTFDLNLPKESIPMKPNIGHSGSSGLLWIEKEFTIVGIYTGTTRITINPVMSLEQLSISLDPKQYDSFKNYCQAIEKELTSGHDGKVIHIWNTEKNCNFEMEIINGKIEHINGPKNFDIDPMTYNTFEEYVNELKSALLKTKKINAHNTGETSSLLTAAPYVVRFVQRFKELNIFKSEFKGIFEI